MNRQCRCGKSFGNHSEGELQGCLIRVNKKLKDIENIVGDLGKC